MQIMTLIQPEELFLLIGLVTLVWGLLRMANE